MVPKTVIIPVVVVVAAAAVGFMLLSQGPSTSTSGAKEFTILITESGPDRAFNPDKITVKVGDKVKLMILNSDTENIATPTSYRFTIKEYSINSGDIAPNKQYVAEFTADKVGIFSYFDPKPDEQNGREYIKHSQLVGQLVVEG